MLRYFYLYPLQFNCEPSYELMDIIEFVYG